MTRNGSVWRLFLGIVVAFCVGGVVVSGLGAADGQRISAVSFTPLATEEPGDVSEVMASPTEPAPAPPYQEYSRPTDPSTAVAVTRINHFAWPASGPISSYFGLGHPTGIDIALDINSDTPVYAAAKGTVAFAGGDPCCEYGLHVELQHEGGFTTLYGHFSRVDVKVGEPVLQGQPLGLGGSTGKADGKHLHFELLRDGQWLDPFRYLPLLGARLPSSDSVGCPSQVIAAGPDSQVLLEVAADAFPSLSFEEAVIDRRTVEAENDGSVIKVRYVAQPVSVATGGTLLSAVSFIFRGQGEIEESFTCRIEVSSNKTLPNIIATREEPRPGGRPGPQSVTSTQPTATPTPTRTPTPTATPTPITLYQVLTPRPTNTPNVPVSFSDGAPPRPSATPFKPAATATPKSKGVRFD